VSYIEDELISLGAAHDYQADLWKMTEGYASSTQNLITLLYQENEQRELNTLQVIFIIGVISSLLTLGAMPTSSLILSDATGAEVMRGEIMHFDLVALLKFGAVAFGLSTLLYLLLHYVFTRFKKFRVVDNSRLRTAPVEQL